MNNLGTLSQATMDAHAFNQAQKNAPSYPALLAANRETAAAGATHPVDVGKNGYCIEAAKLMDQVRGETNLFMTTGSYS